MRFVCKAPGLPASLGILPGAFHPPTRAHLALARAALDSGETQEVLFVLPENFPHKEYDSVHLERRIEMLQASTMMDARFSIGVTTGGLFLEIARDCRRHYSEARLRFLCGADAAERIVSWDYGDLPAIEEQLREYELLVAARGWSYEPPAELRNSITSLAVMEDVDGISSTEVRERIRRGVEWRHLVPEAIHDLIARNYS